MKIIDFFSEKRIVKLETENKLESLKILVNLLANSDKVTNQAKLEKSIIDRENLMSTGIGYGIAIPHARDKSVKDFVIALGIHKKGIYYESIDDKPVHLIFMIASPENKNKEYVIIMSKLSVILKDSELQEKISASDSGKEIYQICLKTGILMK